MSQVSQLRITNKFCTFQIINAIATHNDRCMSIQAWQSCLGGGGGHNSISLPDFFAYTLCTHIQLCSRFYKGLFKDFPVRGRGAFFEKGPYCEIIY